MLVLFALGNAKVLSFALGDAKVPNAKVFVSQWNIGFKPICSCCRLRNLEAAPKENTFFIPHPLILKDKGLGLTTLDYRKKICVQIAVAWLREMPWAYL